MGTHKPSLPLKKPCDISHQSVSRPFVINTFKKIAYSHGLWAPDTVKFSMKSLIFFVLDMGSKPIFCSKITQKSKTCSWLLEPQKVAPNAKCCKKLPSTIRLLVLASYENVRKWEHKYYYMV